jgi:hypothetical protein
MTQYPKEWAVNVTSLKGVPMCRLLKASQTIPPSLPMPAGVPWQKQNRDAVHG